MDNISVAQFLETIKDLSISKEAIYERAKSYFKSNSEITRSDLLRVASNPHRHEIFKGYLNSNNKIPKENFDIIFVGLKRTSEPLKSEIHKLIVESYCKPEIDISAEYFRKISSYLDSETNLLIAQSYLSHKKISAEGYKYMLQYVPEQERSARAAEYLLSNLTIEAEHYKDILYNVLEEGRSEMAQLYIKSNPEISAKDFGEILYHVSEKPRFEMAQSYITSHSEISAEDFGGILYRVDPKLKSEMAESYIKSHPEISAKEFRIFMDQVNGLDPKLQMAKSYIKFNTKITVEDVNAILLTMNANQETTNEIATLFATSHADINLDKYLSEYLKDTNIDKDKKTSLLGFFIIHYQDKITESTWADLRNNKSGLEIDLDVYRKLFDMATQNTTMVVKAMTKLCISPAMRLEVLENVTYNAARCDIFKGIIATLTEDEEIFLNAMEKVGQKIKLSEAEKLTMLQGHNKAIYYNLTPLLSPKLNGEPSLLKEGELKTLQQLFGENLDLTKVSLMDIFTYYEMFGNVQNFVNLLTPEFREKIKQDFKLSEGKPYLFKKEVAALNAITGTDHSLLAVNDLTKYLSDKKAKVVIPTLSKELIDNYQLSFEGIDSLVLAEGETSIESQEKINEKFRQILRNRQLSPLDLIDFFSCFDKDYGTALNGESHQKILDLFEKTYDGFSNKERFAYLFNIPGGVRQFLAQTLFAGDGCVANIGNKVDAIINSAMLSNVAEDLLLNKFFMEKIFVPIVNSERDLIKSETSSLNHPKINDCKLNIESFFAIIKDDVKEIAGDSEENIKNNAEICTKVLSGRIDSVLKGIETNPDLKWIKDWIGEMDGSDKKRRALNDLIVGLDCDLNYDDGWRDSLSEGGLMKAKELFGNAENIKNQYLGLPAMQVCKEIFVQEPFVSNAAVQAIVGQNKLCQDNLLTLLEEKHMVDISAIKTAFIAMEGRRSKPDAAIMTEEEISLLDARSREAYKKPKTPSTAITVEKATELDSKERGL